MHRVTRNAVIDFYVYETTSMLTGRPELKPLPARAELATCIEMILTDPDLGDEMRKLGAELLAERYSWQAIAGATVAVYAGHPSSL